MSSQALQHGVRRGMPLGPAEVVPPTIAVIFTAGTVGHLSGAITVPHHLAAAIGIPLGFAAALVFRRTEAAPALRLSSYWTLLFGAGVLGARLVDAQPLAAVAAPAVLLSAICVSRYPVAAVVGLFLLASAVGSLEALTPIPVGETVDLLLVGLWLALLWAYLGRGRDHPVLIWPSFLLFLAYPVLTGFEVLTVDDLDYGVRAFRISAWYMLGAFIVAYGLWAPGTRDRMARGVVLVTLAVGWYTVYRWWAGPAPEEYAYAAVSDPTNFLDGSFRLVGTFASAKALGTWCAMLIPFCLSFALVSSGRWRRLALLACFACAIGLLGSEARTALVAVAAGVALVFLLYQLARAVPGAHLGVTVTTLLAVATIGAFAFAFTIGPSERSVQRYTRLLTPSEDPAVQARLVRWRTVLKDIDRYPFGQGIGSAGRIQRERGRFANIAAINVDNSYLQIAFEQGLFAMLLFIGGALALLGALAKRAITTLDPHKAAIAIGAAGALTAYLSALPTGSYYEGLHTLALALLVGLGVGQFTRAERPAAQPAR